MIEYVQYYHDIPARFFVTETRQEDGAVQTWGYPNRGTAMEYIKDKSCSTPEPGMWQLKGTKEARA